MRVHPASSQEPYYCFPHHPEQPFSACWRVKFIFIMPALVYQFFCCICWIGVGGCGVAGHAFVGPAFTLLVMPCSRNVNDHKSPSTVQQSFDIEPKQKRQNCQRSDGNKNINNILLFINKCNLKMFPFFFGSEHRQPRKFSFRTV